MTGTTSYVPDSFCDTAHDCFCAETTEIDSVHVLVTTDTDDVLADWVGSGVAGTGVYVGDGLSGGKDGCNGSPVDVVQQTISLRKNEHPRSPADWFVGFAKQSA